MGDTNDVNNMAFIAACYLAEGNQTEALHSLLNCDVDFVAEHDYQTETGFQGHEPDTIWLYGPREVYDRLKDDSDELTTQIRTAFEVALGSNWIGLKCKYRPIKRVEQIWHQRVLKELPQFNVIEAEFVDAEPDS